MTTPLTRKPYTLYLTVEQGIGLCNLVTTIVVEFNKVVEEEEEMQKTLRSTPTPSLYLENPKP